MVISLPIQVGDFCSFCLWGLIFFSNPCFVRVYQMDKASAQEHKERYDRFKSSYPCVNRPKSHLGGLTICRMKRAVETHARMLLEAKDQCLREEPSSIVGQAMKPTGSMNLMCWWSDVNPDLLCFKRSHLSFSKEFPVEYQTLFSQTLYANKNMKDAILLRVMMLQDVEQG